MQIINRVPKICNASKISVTLRLEDCNIFINLAKMTAEELLKEKMFRFKFIDLAEMTVENLLGV